MIKFIIDAISKGLAFSKTEAKGTFVLIIIVLLSITSFRFISSKIKTRKTSEYDPSELTAWVKEVASSYTRKTGQNEIPESSLQRVVKKERKPTFSKEKENALEPNEIEVPILDLNISSAQELQKVRGIGNVYSERIVKYREMLGGYVSIEQLKEVYGLTDEVVAKIGERFSVQSNVERIEINSDSVKLLARHPYISYDLAWVILNYRKQNGDIKNFEDLKEIKALNDSILLKLRPYLE